MTQRSLNSERSDKASFKKDLHNWRFFGSDIAELANEYDYPSIPHYYCYYGLKVIN